MQPGEVEWSGCVDETGAMLLCGRVERVWMEGGMIGRSTVGVVVGLKGIMGGRRRKAGGVSPWNKCIA